MPTAGVERKNRTTIAIVGGGVSGSLTAYHLIHQHRQVRVVLIDPRAELGLGLAYSTPTLRHLLNVPAARLSALPDQPLHFLHWLQAHHDPQATGHTFAPRAVFGRYVQSLLAATKGIKHLQTAVLDYRPSASGAVLTLADGSELSANLVVLATGNFDPAPLPGIHREVQASGAYRHNAWLLDTFDALHPDAPVTLIGTGLTGVDVLLRLRELGHRGVITAISRHGVLPHRHTAYTPLADAAIPTATPATCMAYLQAFRTAIRNGAPWRAAMDSLRATTNDLWLALPLAEQQRFRRHLQRRWDVARHRMAPPIADRIDAELAAGTLRIRKGHLAAVDPAPAGAIVMMQTPRGIETLAARRVINCTGPAMNYRRVDSPLFRSLFSQAIVVSGPLGGGFHCAANGALIAAGGQPSRVLFNLGPGRLGTLLESIAIPEIRQQAVALAKTLTANLALTGQACFLPGPFNAGNRPADTSIEVAA